MCVCVCVCVCMCVSCVRVCVCVCVCVCTMIVKWYYSYCPIYCRHFLLHPWQCSAKISVKVIYSASGYFEVYRPQCIYGMDAVLRPFVDDLRKLVRFLVFQPLVQNNMNIYMYTVHTLCTSKSLSTLSCETARKLVRYSN